MSRLDFSDPKVEEGIREVLTGKAEWVLLTYVPNSNKIKVHTKGEEDYSEMLEEVNDGKVQYFYVRFAVGGGLYKYVYIAFLGEGVTGMLRGSFNNHVGDVEGFLKKLRAPIHVQINARNEADLNEEDIKKKLRTATGSNYDAGAKQQGARATFITGVKEGVNVHAKAQEEAAKYVGRSLPNVPDADTRQKFWDGMQDDSQKFHSKQPVIDESQRQKFWQEQQKDEGARKAAPPTNAPIGSTAGAGNIKSQFEQKSAEQKPPVQSTGKQWKPQGSAPPPKSAAPSSVPLYKQQPQPTPDASASTKTSYQPPKPSGPAPTPTISSAPPVKSTPPPITSSAPTVPTGGPPVPSGGHPPPSGPPVPSGGHSFPSGGHPPPSGPPVPSGGHSFPSGGPPVPSGGPPPPSGGPPVPSGGHGFSSGGPPVPTAGHQPPFGGHEPPPPEHFHSGPPVPTGAPPTSAPSFPTGGPPVPSGAPPTPTGPPPVPYGAPPAQDEEPEDEGWDDPPPQQSAPTMSYGEAPPDSIATVQALYPFEAEQDTDLTFNEGDVIYVLDNSDPSGWWKGRDIYGNEGYFPMNFVQ